MIHKLGATDNKCEALYNPTKPSNLIQQTKSLMSGPPRFSHGFTSASCDTSLMESEEASVMKKVFDFNKHMKHTHRQSP